MSAIFEARQVGKSYVGGDGSPIVVLDGLDLTVEPGEFVAIVGASGSGKSTLLNLRGALDEPTTGVVRLDGRDLAGLDVETKSEIRNRRIGFVFQFHHLLRDFSAVENVMLPLLIGGMAEDAARARAEDVLGQLGLSGRLHHYPSQLSGGEQQRVAVARAVGPAPAVVLADEPSGNLDPQSAQVLHDVLAGLRDRFESALVVATHNPSLAARADRTLRLENGKLTEVIAAEALEP